MKISLNWLKRYVDLQADWQELENVLPKLGFEVDSITHTGVGDIPNVFVGKVLKKEPHPDADRLSVCQVQTSLNEPARQIVCGASNFKEGDCVPVAVPGAVFGDFKIKEAKLRGVDSAGMMCAASELGLPGDAKGLLILDTDKPVGTPIAELFPEGDVIFDLEITANRGDALSHIGIARELAAYYNLELKHPNYRSFGSLHHHCDHQLVHHIEVSSENCPYYTACSIKGVKVGESPDWLKASLESIGLRSVNNVVDITNRIMFETGQPLHAFDVAKIEGDTLQVRQAKPGETITTLDEKKRKLSEDMLVVADAKKPLVIAGVMGSIDAEVDNTTTDILLEAAYFNPSNIRSTSRKLGIFSDSSYRFARDVDPAMTLKALHRAADKIVALCGGKLLDDDISEESIWSITMGGTIGFGGIDPESGHGAFVYGQPPRGCVEIEFNYDFVRSRCGFQVEDAVIADALKRLGFEVSAPSHGKSQVVVPSFRSEVLRPIDLVEEFLRIHGMDELENIEPSTPVLNRKDDALHTFKQRTRDYLCAQGFDEAWHYSLTSQDEVRSCAGEDLAKTLALANPLAEEQSHLRASLLPGLLRALEWNTHHGNQPTAFWEMGKVFREKNGQIDELFAVSGVLLQKQAARHWKPQQAPDFFTIKSIAAQVLKLANVAIADSQYRPIEDDLNVWQSGHNARAGKLAKRGYELSLGILNLKRTHEFDIDGPVLAFEFLVSPKVLNRETEPTSFAHFGNYPSVSKDIAVLVEADLPAAKLADDLERAAQKAVGKQFDCKHITLFDVYDGKGIAEGHKSLSFELVFASDARTLGDEEVSRAFAQIQKAIDEKPNYTVRSA